MTHKPKVAIVGYGRVGKVLMKALSEAGWEVSALATRQNGVLCAQCSVLKSVKELPDDIGLVILCLRDKDIGQAVLNIPNSKFQTPNFLCHTSGALSAEILAPARERGWKVMAWHPMQTFTGDEDGDVLKGVTFGIDGDEEAVLVGEQLARDLGGVPFRVPPELRREYHLGAVIACNLLVGLVGEAVELLKRTGMDEERALQAVTPLMTATIRNISRKGLQDSITGPILRGDAETIRKHLETLQRLPEVEKLYRLLSLSLVKRLEETGERDILKEMLEDNRYGRINSPG